MKKKLELAKEALGFQIKKLSISTTLIIHILYIIYLTYSLKSGVGNKTVNLILLVGTVVFLLIYLILRLFGGKKKSIKSTKRFYKRFKLFAKSFTAITAIYSLVTATKAISPIASFVSMAGAVFVLLRLVADILSYLFISGIKNLFSGIKKKSKDNYIERLIDEETEDVETCNILEDDL